MRINHNLSAMDALRNLNSASTAQALSSQKLSSGKRITSAADDAAGLAISQGMESQIQGLDQASRNSQDAISLLQTGEGALNETQSILKRMRDLSVEAASDTYTANDRTQIQSEVDQLKSEIDRIGNTTTFNGKSLLNGSASALSSTDNVNTQVFVRGAIASGGSYKLSITAQAGNAQIQKSNIFKISSGEVLNNLTIAAGTGINSVDGSNLKYGNYTIAATANHATAGAGNDDSAVTLGNFYKQASGAVANVFGGGAATMNDDTNTKNMSVMAQITNISGNNVTYKLDYHSLDVDGTVADGTTTATVDVSAASNVTVNGVQLNFAAGAVANLSVGDKQTLAVTGDHNTTGNYDEVATSIGGGGGTPSDVVVNSGVLNNTSTDLKFYNVDSTTGQVYDGKISLNVGGLTSNASAVTFTAADGTGQLASANTKLSDIDKFTDSSGANMLENPQTLQLIEGDGKKTTVQLYGSDTIQDVVNKLNTAIGTGLGQKDILANSADASKFASFVTTAAGSGPLSTAGTVVINSAKAGADGKINVVGDENLINALGLSDVQSATETKFNVTVTDATNPSNIVASNVSIQGNELIGVVDNNVDVKFASNSGIDANWSASSGKFALTSSGSAANTMVNLVSNTQVFQIGANEAQNMSAAIGDMRSAALGVDNVLVTDQASASKATTVIDNAIKRVSAQQSQFGALQNRLQHTINNLGVAGQNLTASESQIQDVDMAQEMTNYSKNSILTQTANAMLAKANQSPQMVLQLLQG